MKNEAPMWVGITYLVYVITIWAICIVGTGYAVFVLGHSGWWFLAAIAIGGSGYSPWRWHSIFTGEEVPFSKYSGQR